VSAVVPDAALVAAARAAFVRLVPRVAIGSSPDHGRSLAQLETLFWLDTPVVVDLGTRMLLGVPVHLVATVTSTAWDFGDGASGVSAGPGRAVTVSDQCSTRLCPGWFGHTYTRVAQGLTVTATATWAGAFGVGDGALEPIAGTVDAPPVEVGMQVVEARAVLVDGDRPA
jgi:hypothetical protein